MDTVKLAVALLLVSGATLAFYYYAEASLLVAGPRIAWGGGSGSGCCVADGTWSPDRWVFERCANRSAQSGLAESSGNYTNNTRRVADCRYRRGGVDGFGWRTGVAHRFRDGYEELKKMALRWYVVHAYSGFESQVKRSLEERIKRSGMTKKFGDILVPTEEVVEMRDGQKRRSDRKFFPGYVLVQMDMDDDSWHLVKDVPKVMGFLGGTSDRPAPIADHEADSILQRMQDGTDKPRPKILFEVGEVIRVKERTVYRLQRRGGRGELRKKPSPGCSINLRTLDARGPAIRTGGQGLRSGF